MLHFGKIPKQFSETWVAFPPRHPIYPDCGHGRRHQADAVRSGKETVARRERSAMRGHLSTPAVGARIGLLCKEEPQRKDQDESGCAGECG